MISFPLYIAIELELKLWGLFVLESTVDHLSLSTTLLIVICLLHISGLCTSVTQRKSHM